MSRAALLMALAVAATATSLYLVTRPEQTPGEQAANRTFLLVVRQKKLLSGQTTLQVNQGDRVEIQVQTDVAEELHLHGYNLLAELKPDATSRLKFTADRAGRFEYELERSDLELGALEVAPR